MAINAATVWEIRTTGSQANSGGFYNRTPGTSVDYSQQDAAQLSLTDLATNVAGTGLSSATGGFTDAMIGNIIHITSGTGFTAGWYEITARADTNNVTIDRSAGSSASSGTGAVGGAFLLGGTLDDEMVSSIVGGNTVHIKAGTYTLGEILTPVAAAANAAVSVIGYNTARNDTPVGDNRPLIDGGATYYLTSPNCWKYSYLRFTGSAALVVNIT